MSFYIEEYFLEKTPSFGNAIFAINPHIWMIDGCRPKNYVEKVIETITKYYKKNISLKVKSYIGMNFILDMKMKY